MLSQLCLTATLCIAAHQAPLSMGLSRQGYRIALPFPPPRDLTDTGIEGALPWVSCIGGWTLYHRATWEAICIYTYIHVYIHIQSDEKGKWLKDRNNKNMWSYNGKRRSWNSSWGIKLHSAGLEYVWKDCIYLVKKVGELRGSPGLLYCCLVAKSLSGDSWIGDEYIPKYRTRAAFPVDKSEKNPSHKGLALE